MLHLVGVVFAVVAGLPQGDEAAIDRVYRDQSLQRDLPPPRKPEPDQKANPDASARGRRAGRGPGAGGRPERSGNASPPLERSVVSGGADFGVAALWMLAMIAGGYVLWQIGRAITEALRGRRARPPPQATTALPPDETLAAELQPDHARLAAQGMFAEAIHMLLLDACAGLGLRTQLAPALTARELRAVVPLQPVGRAAFSALVAAVEISRYGQRAVTQAIYDACVAHRNAVVPLS